MTNCYIIPYSNVIPKSTFDQVRLVTFNKKNIVSRFTENDVDEEAVFDELITNKIFLNEAKRARREIMKNPTQFTNYTEKYSSLIE